MSTTTFTAHASTATRSARPTIWRHGLAATAAAAVATTTGAAIAKAAGVTFADHTGASIPTAGFPELTVVFALIGVGVAAVIARRASRPRRTFTRTVLALLALSFVPDVVSGFGVASAASLIALHSLAAAIVVPTLASRLNVRR